MSSGHLPAFPVADYDHQVFNPTTVHDTERLLSGMSMREYYAAHSPVSMVDANESLHQTSAFGKPSENGAYPMHLVLRELVRLRWEYADAMLAAGEHGGAV